MLPAQLRLERLAGPVVVKGPGVGGEERQGLRAHADL